MNIKAAALAVSLALSGPVQAFNDYDLIFFPWLTNPTQFVCRQETSWPTTDNSPSVRYAGSFIPVVVSQPTPAKMVVLLGNETIDLSFKEQSGFEILTYQTQGLLVSDIRMNGARILYGYTEGAKFRCEKAL